MVLTAVLDTLRNSAGILNKLFAGTQLCGADKNCKDTDRLLKMVIWARKLSCTSNRKRQMRLTNNRQELMWASSTMWAFMSKSELLWTWLGLSACGLKGGLPSYNGAVRSHTGIK